ncbi:MAG: rhomboid family intramembrane serine protease [Candidatus Aenigmarchaeota archaeon]|nr:rhomboid family intramembrane serine protease [Candidatus Aenigmarchaeota archaeon]
MKYFDYYAFKLVGICVAVFILQLSIPSITDDFALVSKDVAARPWILVTSIFLHGSFDHLLFNMFALAMFGSILERTIGSRRFLIVFFATGVIASLGSIFFYNAALGASGAIMGIAGCLAIIRPRMMVWVMGMPMPMIFAAGLWAVIDMAGMFHPSGIANAAHLAGLFSGIALGIAWRKRFALEKSKSVISENEIDHWEKEYMK